MKQYLTLEVQNSTLSLDSLQHFLLEETGRISSC